jgi:hypothetical protein
MEAMWEQRVEDVEERTGVLEGRMLHAERRCEDAERRFEDAERHTDARVRALAHRGACRAAARARAGSDRDRADMDALADIVKDLIVEVRWYNEDLLDASVQQQLARATPTRSAAVSLFARTRLSRRKITQWLSCKLAESLR